MSMIMSSRYEYSATHKAVRTVEPCKSQPVVRVKWHCVHNQQVGLQYLLLLVNSGTSHDRYTFITRKLLILRFGSGNYGLLSNTLTGVLDLGLCATAGLPCCLETLA